MTTRHTITHADEIYAGNAFKDGYSPDGRRGIQMTHLYLHNFRSTAGAAVVAGIGTGIFTASFLVSTWAASAGANNVSSANGSLASSAGATWIDFDVPRNLILASTGNESTKFLKIHGLDQYGEAMCETLKGPNNTTVSGRRYFKSITRLYTTAAWTATAIKLGTGNKLGVPFHLQTKDQIVAVSVDGKTVTSGGTGFYTINIGASYATTITTSNGQLDVRGSVQMLNPAPDGTKTFSALIAVDHTTNRKAFGPPQVSSCSDGV